MNPETHAEVMAMAIDAVIRVIQTDTLPSPSPPHPRPLGSALSLLLDFFESKERETPSPTLLLFLAGAPTDGLGVRYDRGRRRLCVCVCVLLLRDCKVDCGYFMSAGHQHHDLEACHEIQCWKNHFFGRSYFIFQTLIHIFFSQLGERAAQIDVTMDLYLIQQSPPPRHRLHEEALAFGCREEDREKGSGTTFAESGCFQLKALKHLAKATGMLT